jgi:hypothetical protein
MNKPKLDLWIESLETEATFYGVLALVCDELNQPQLATAATKHAFVLQRRAAVARAEAAKPKPAPKPKAKPSKPKPPKRKPAGWNWPKR